MNLLGIFLKISIVLCAATILPETLADDGNKTEVKNKTGAVDLDDRININFNQAVATAHNKEGVSGSDSSSIGFNAGLLYPSGHLDTLVNHSDSKANTFATNDKAPSTFAQTGTESKNQSQGIKGSAEAGYSGGEGNAWSTSNSDHMEIQLGDGGPLLLSNLQTPNKSEKKTDSKDSSKIKPSAEPLTFVRF